MKHVSSRKSEYHKNIMCRRTRSARKRLLGEGREAARLVECNKTRSWSTAPLMKWWYFMREGIHDAEF